LTEVGLTLSDVVEMTTYHVGLKEQLEVFKQIKDEFINEPYPAWTAIGVSELAVDGALIEIRVIAKEKDSI
jgi:enamine deaminase RidA (YjgF/YER057c/UK114 family)